ncbi:hypothetical protein R2F25_38640 [Streptomyces sp. UP1A-1]|nr:hypothetical protein [Streptomyces sp. UP1A-1]
MQDALNAITAALARRFPDVPAEPEALPLGPDKADEIMEAAGGPEEALFTSDIHPSLLGGADDEEDQAEAEEEPPTYRFVDRLNRGWHIASSEQPVRYAIDWAGLRPDRPDDLLTRAELEAEHGPLRPVGPGDPSDDLVLRGALADAGTKAAGSVLVALYRLAVEYSRASSPGGYEGGSLVAGREGSWESEAVYRLAWTIGGDLDEKPKRYSEECVSSVMAVLREWTQHPKRYVEVAENLAERVLAGRRRAGRLEQGRRPSVPAVHEGGPAPAGHDRGRLQLPDVQVFSALARPKRRDVAGLAVQSASARYRIPRRYRALLRAVSRRRSRAEPDQPGRGPRWCQRLSRGRRETGRSPRRGWRPGRSPRRSGRAAAAARCT